ncbi:hypothetical protein [Nostoc sp. PCC 7107]|uniref:hypothetical protein n=1 Tax=Nostoc sp. PCC 7107 TaxID=317936 RepID=UPI0002D8943C|nr:hypothetical protein [Nostoc sp. PCC 7107]
MSTTHYDQRNAIASKNYIQMKVSYETSQINRIPEGLDIRNSYQKKSWYTSQLSGILSSERKD